MNRIGRDLFRRLRPALLLALGLLILDCLIAFFGGVGLQRAATEAMIYVVVVVGLYTFVGTSGVISFGHISFMLLGAYITAWQTCCAGLKGTFMPGLPDFLVETTVPILPAILIAGFGAGAFGLLAGTAIMRLGGVAASIATLALLAVIKISFENWDSITSGHSSIIGLPIVVNKWVGLAWASLVLIGAALYQTSRWGIAVRLGREDEVAARACGVNVYIQRLVAFTLSACFVGLGGALYGLYLGTIAVDIFWLDMTFITLAMLVVGGRTSLSGAVVGVLCVVFVSEAFRILNSGITIASISVSTPDGLDKIALAIVMLVVLALRPKGIMGGREIDEVLFPAKLPSTQELGGQADAHLHSLVKPDRQASPGASGLFRRQAERIDARVGELRKRDGQD